MPKVYQRAPARRDLVEHFVYLAEYASLETAERFLDSAKASFYLPRPDGVAVVRVLHGARDWWGSIGLT